ncbi:hypothetical protein QAD02_001814 [Eretmocerus hayati]|uniref:Uncharacterized protein n=1 Tax=Eretmocerus hayati TaxID=131215 RepID=A0ACC2NH80_9HYME|nr:hypothetical protein QAD02_001814 [Eretmocerus hayati]
MHKLIARSFLRLKNVVNETCPCRCRFMNNLRFDSHKLFTDHWRSYSDEKFPEIKNSLEDNDKHNLPPGFVGKFKVFRDEDAPIIFDVNEEKKRIELSELDTLEEESDPFQGFNLTHGVNGVYEIEDLVEVLQKENARQIFVASVPKEYSYVDYIVVVTAKSPRHMLAVATLVRKLFKMKRHKSDRIPKIEGASSKEWMALDLGNIALHILSSEARIRYDLETLWSVGSEFDDISNKKEDNEDMMDKYKSFLKDLQPAE